MRSMARCLSILRGRARRAVFAAEVVRRESRGVVCADRPRAADRRGRERSRAAGAFDLFRAYGSYASLSRLGEIAATVLRIDRGLPLLR